MADLSKTEPGWYCFKAMPKKEHIAGQLLRRVEGVIAFSPRISFIKKTRRGKVRFVESLFPGYVFVHADLQVHYRHIRSIQGIRDVVAFGDRVPEIPAVFIEELQKRIGEETVAALPEPDLEVGQEVSIAEGPFREWKAIISGAMDGHQRVAVLLDFLGRQMEIQVPAKDLLIEGEQPREKLWEE